MQRFLNNPIIVPQDIPDILPDIVDPSSVFNPGAVRFNDKILLMLRVQNRARETYLVMAESCDGINFNIERQYIVWEGLGHLEKEIYHIYDPRITQIGDVFYIMFAMDMTSGCYLGLGKTYDFKRFEFMGIVSEEDNRNGVLFSEKINEKFIRMDRPNKKSLDSQTLCINDIWISESEDLLTWIPVKKLISGRRHFWDELLGPGPPPLKTEKGWLSIYHGIAMHYQPIYQAGVMLLDLNDPSIVIARGKFNILEPRMSYETTGQVPNVVFPTGLIAEDIDKNGCAKPESEVKLYYGAADTVIAMATATVESLNSALH